MKKLLILTTTLLALTLSASAQSIQERIKQVPDAKKFKVEYDKFKDLTTISTHINFRLLKTKRYGGELSILGRFAGSDVTEDVKVFLLGCDCLKETSYEPLPALSAAPRLIFLFDGRKLDLGEGTVNGGYADLPLSYGRLYYRNVTFTIKRDDLRELSNSKDIELQIGRFEGLVEKDGQPRIKTMYDLTAKPK
jgi:hypothetical protein